jgi:pteridine reductase
MVASSTAAPARGRTALVTGSARRVGREIAQALVRAGWRVLIHATHEAAASDAAVSLGAAGAVGADLRDPDAAATIGAAVRAQLGGELDLLVNSAASFERVGSWQNAGLDGWARAMDVNARAPYLLTAELLPELTAAHGLVVNVSDRAGHEHWPAFPIHSASKAALDSLTISGAQALARVGVRVNAVAPGTILAPDDWDRARIELERAAGTIGTPDELTRTILELADDPARTGEIIVL